MKEWFPRRVRDKSPAAFLLQHTRHTPRDFLQLLSFVQQFASRDHHTLGRDQVLRGIQKYCRTYFADEIRDELVGYLEPNEIDETLSALSSLAEGEFSFEEFHTAISTRSGLHHRNPAELARILFDCSALGNLVTRPGENPRRSFRYRNPNAELQSERPMVLHRALAHSF
jgi:hypothetical protein